MTIVGLADGGLWVHSPTALSPELVEKIQKFGSVSFIVGASNIGIRIKTMFFC